MTSRRRLAWLVGCFVLSLPAVTLRMYASDEIQYYSYLRSLWFDRDLSFDNEYRHFHDSGVARYELFHATFLEPTTETGLRVNFGTLGSAMLWAPFYLAGDLTARLGGLVGRSISTDGYSKPYVAAVCLGSALYGFLAILISGHIARSIAGDGLAAAIAVWTGTPLLFYMYVAPVFAHATSAFAVTLFIAAWLRARHRWAHADVLLLGGAAALMTMVREQDVFMVAGPILDFLVSREVGRQKARITTVIVGCVAFAIAYTPQLLAYQTINGRFGPSPLVTRKMTWTSPHLLDVLLSTEHGFFFWTPLAILALGGVIWLCVARVELPESAYTVADRRWLGICLLVMFVMNVYVTGSVESWTAAGAFGQRRFVNMTPLLVIGLAVIVVRLRAPVARAGFIAVVVLCVWWNVALIAQFGTHMMDRQRLDLRRNAYNAFVTLPRRTPELAYRYFVDRESFYKP